MLWLAAFRFADLFAVGLCCCLGLGEIGGGLRCCLGLVVLVVLGWFLGVCAVVWVLVVAVFY